MDIINKLIKLKGFLNENCGLSDYNDLEIHYDILDYNRVSGHLNIEVEIYFKLEDFSIITLNICCEEQQLSEDYWYIDNDGSYTDLYSLTEPVHIWKDIAFRYYEKARKIYSRYEATQARLDNILEGEI